MVHRLTIDADGRLRLPDDQKRKWGLQPGADFLVQERPEGLLLRREDPLLSRVYVEPTNRCNLNCRTCVRNSWSEPEGFMSMDSYRRLATDLHRVPSLQKVSFWGFGEPLLHPDIVEMVALAKDTGARTEIVTNGMLLTPELSRRLVEVELDSIVFSVDGATPDVYSDVRIGAQMELLFQNVRHLLAYRAERPEAKPEIGIEFVAMRRNLSDLPKLRLLANSIRASFIIVSNLLPYTEEMSDEILYGWNAGTCYPVFRSRWSPDILLPRMDRRRDVMAAVAALLEHTYQNDFPIGRLDNAAGYCRFVGEGTAAITWKGDVAPCVALMHSYNCYVMRRPKRIRAYSLGNIDEEGIAEIWEKDEFAAFRKRVQRFGFSPCTDCGGCDFAETNEEDCFGNSFPTCGDCLWAKGVLQCP